MKKVIAGKLYDTDKAQKLAEWDNGQNYAGLQWTQETLYRKRTGEYFLHGDGGAGSRYAQTIGQNQWSGGEAIQPMSYDVAKEWAESHLTGDEYVAIFGEPDEGKITKAISLDSQTVAALDKLRSESGKTYGEIIAGLVNRTAAV